MTALRVHLTEDDSAHAAGMGELAASARQQLLRDRIRSGVRTPAKGTTAIPRRQEAGPAPLSVSQRQLWYLSQLAPESTAYNELATLRKEGPVDLAAVRAAFNEFVRRHEAWRTTFELVDGEPRQVVHAPQVYPLPLLDLSGLSPEVAEQQAAEVAVEDTRRPYDLVTGPLVRARLVRLAPDDHRLYLSMHHIVFDGVTLYRILLPEIVALYDAYSQGLPSPLPEPTLQYSDYAAWEVDWASGPEVEARVEYWREHLAGAPTVELPTDYPRPAVRRYVGGTVPTPVDAVTSELLRAAAQRAGVSLFQLLTALYAWWLGRYSTDDEIVFATVTDLRTRPELVDMAGYCLAPVVLRVDVSGQQTVEEFISRVRADLLDGLDHVVPFQWLVQQLGATRDPRRNPVFQVSFELEPPLLSPDPSWSLHQMDGSTSDAVGQAKFDLTIELDERPDGHIDGRLLYDADLFTAASARQMSHHWTRLLKSVASASPGASLAEIDTDDEVSRFSVAVDLDGEQRCIQDLIHDRVERQPDALAVVSEDRSLTYAELEASALTIAARLVRAGAGPGAVVAAVLDRSVDLVAGLLGILMSGAAYLPLDPRHPASRLRFVVGDAGATLLLTQSTLSATLPDLGLTAILLDQPVDEPGVPELVPRAPVSPEDLAYVIYTSGSTGQPKGVGVEIRSVTHLMGTLLQRVGLSSADVIASVSAYTFDGSVGDIFCGLGLGARIVLASGEQTADPRALAELLHQSAATFMTATPTTWAGLVQVGWRAGSRFTAACGGETLPEDLASELLDRSDAVWNFFGPTEATVWATSGRLWPGEPVTVGTPLPGTDVSIADSAGRRTPVGVPGEIVIGGPQVARGYVNRPEETARRFGASPLSRGGRLYRTGDRGRLLPGGELRHLGRLDDQFKIRGYRIEPGEIESTLRQHPAVLDAAIAVRSGESGDPVLALYVVTHAGRDTPGDTDIRAWVRSRLPDYMTPTVIVRLSALPRSSSGKLDRSALPNLKSLEPSQNITELRLDCGTQQEDLLGPMGLDTLHAGRTNEDPFVRDAVVRAWCQLLHVSRVDQAGNFFELGGHSLLAVKLAVLLERELGTRIELGPLLRSGPTIDGIVELIASLQSQSRSLATLSGAGTSNSRPTALPPVFFLYPNLESLALHRHFLPIFSAGYEPIGWHLDDTVFQRHSGDAPRKLAGSILAQIRRIQPEGPYRIAGYSFGGLVAYHVAERLTSNLEHVEWLCLLDTATPDAMAQSRRLVPRLARGLREGSVSFISRSIFLVWHTVRDVRRRRSSDLMRRSTVQRDNRVCQESGDFGMVLVASASSALACGSRWLGWEKKHADRLTLVEVPGDHVSMIDGRTREVVVSRAFATLSGSSTADPARQ